MEHYQIFGTVFLVLHLDIINWQRQETDILIKVFVKKIRHRTGVHICLILFFEKQLPGGFLGFGLLFGFFFKVNSQKHKIIILSLFFCIMYMETW